MGHKVYIEKRNAPFYGVNDRLWKGEASSERSRSDAGSQATRGLKFADTAPNVALNSDLINANCSYAAKCAQKYEHIPETKKTLHSGARKLLTWSNIPQLARIIEHSVIQGRDKFRSHSER